jgi:hypothetical protein
MAHASRSASPVKKHKLLTGQPLDGYDPASRQIPRQRMRGAVESGIMPFFREVEAKRTGIPRGHCIGAFWPLAKKFRPSDFREEY